MVTLKPHQMIGRAEVVSAPDFCACNGEYDISMRIRVDGTEAGVAIIGRYDKGTDPRTEAEHLLAQEISCRYPSEN